MCGIRQWLTLLEFHVFCPLINVAHGVKDVAVLPQGVGRVPVTQHQSFPRLALAAGSEYITMYSVDLQ